MLDVRIACTARAIPHAGLPDKAGDNIRATTHMSTAGAGVAKLFALRQRFPRDLSRGFAEA